MGAASGRKGAKAELEVQALIQQHLGFPARRMLGAGRKDDVGDITGVPDHTIQVANWPREGGVAAAIRQKPVECEEQRQRAGTVFAATFIRLVGGDYRVVLTVEQWATLVREALADVTA